MRKVITTLCTFLTLSLIQLQSVFADTTRVMLHVDEDSVTRVNTVNQVINEPMNHNGGGTFTGDTTHLLMFLGIIIGCVVLLTVSTKLKKTK